jgi:hypothetical protein
MADKKITELDELEEISFDDVLAIVDSPGAAPLTKKVALSTLFRPLITTKTATYNATANDDIIVCNKTTAMSINLPAATGTGKRLTIKNINIGTVTVDADTTELIEGELTQDLLEGECIMIIDYANGKWLVV